MVSQKHTTRVAPNVSTATSLSTANATYQANASVIQKTAFAPSRFQLALFASVIEGLHGPQVRAHDSVTGKLQSQYDTHASHVYSLDWGYLGGGAAAASGPLSTKKRKRLDEVNGIDASRNHVVIAAATNRSEIQFFSAAGTHATTSLQTPHASGVKDFKFTKYGLSEEGWSLGMDKKLVQWNLRDQAAIR